MAPFQTINQGYDVNATRRADPPGANGELASEIMASPNNRVKLWVYDVTTGFAMSGSTGQSARTRTFFPHNFVQPAFTVSCQCANQEIYARTIEFIRSTQITFDPSVNFRLYNAPYDARFGFAANQQNKGQYKHNSIKGRHRGNAAQGYIKSVKRLHERFTYAPELQFTFVVERYLGPIGWRDKSNQHPSAERSWSEIIMQHKSGIARDPDTTVTSDNVAPNVVLAPGPDGRPRPT